MISGNYIPDQVSRIHLIAICGTGMAALACMLKDMGYAVTGSDVGIYPPVSLLLESHHIPVMMGYDPAHLDHRPDLIVVGNAVSRNNPEIIGMIESKIPYCSMPQAINQFAARNRRSVVVAGTHGKTTTSSLIAWILHSAGLDPSFIIGGILKNFGSNYRCGHGDIIVLEGDEYDTAFFDKKSKFLHYTPYRAVLTGIEFDHADIFTGINQIELAFQEFLHRIPDDGKLFAFDSGISIEAVLNSGQSVFDRYGQNPASRWCARNLILNSSGMQFDVFHAGSLFGHYKTPLLGRHNVWNALAAIAVADSIDISKDITASAIASFQGVRRRQEIRGCVNGVTVMDDFAHHPTAVQETILAVKPHCSDGRLIAVFEPGTHTSMRAIFQNTYPAAFLGADEVCIRKPSRIEKVPLQERLSPEKLVEDMNDIGLNAQLFPDTQSIVRHLVQTVRPNDIVLIMSNSGFDNIHQHLIDRLIDSKPQGINDELCVNSLD